MAEMKFTKNALRDEQKRLQQLEKYLPTLQLKKAMLQGEVQKARAEREALTRTLAQVRATIEKFTSLLTEQLSVDPAKAAHSVRIHKRYENIAGVEVPYFEGVDFAPFAYTLFDTPPWLDAVVDNLRRLAEAKIQVDIAEEKRQALDHELREVSIRVNLFEKRLIPRAKGKIKRIAVFLGDQALAAVGRAKVAKTKIELLRARSKPCELR